MEKEPSFENKESTEERLMRLLKEKGVEDPEAKSLLDTWTREQEKQVEVPGRMRVSGYFFIVA